MNIANSRFKTYRHSATTSASGNTATQLKLSECYVVSAKIIEGEDCYTALTGRNTASTLWSFAIRDATGELVANTDIVMDILYYDLTI